MNKPIERVYVIENNLEGPMRAAGFDENPERAERFREAIKGVTRVFVEEREWRTAAVPPSHGRPVLALMVGVRRPIVAVFGSESKWLALDHDGRLTYLGESVLVWCEMPELPEYK